MYDGKPKLYLVVMILSVVVASFSIVFAILAYEEGKALENPGERQKSRREVILGECVKTDQWVATGIGGGGGRWGPIMDCSGVDVP